jgi:hypothetical protein
VGALALALQTACRSAGGPTPPAVGTGPLADAGRALAGQHRILRFDGKKKAVSLKMQDASTRTGPCDLAVEIKSAVFSGGSARFALEPVGQPRLEGQAREKRGKRSPCRDFPAETTLALTGLEGNSAEKLTAEAGRVLLTVEDYLKAHGVRFDRPAGADSKEIADPALTATPEEQRVARAVTAKPRRLLAIDPVYRSPNKVRYEGQVELVAVVGVDGRLHQPRVTTTLDDHAPRVLRVLPLWRYEPARRGDEPVAMRLTEKAVFRIF